MKKLFKTTGFMFAVSLILASCGGHKKEKVTLAEPPQDLKYEAVTLVDGPLSDYMEIVPGSYLFELKKNESDYYSNYDGVCKVKIKFLKSTDIKAGIGYNQYGPSLLGKALDEQGAPLEFQLNATADKDLATYLQRGSGEEWITLKLSAHGSISSQQDADDMLAKFQKGKKIRLNSEIVEEKSGSSSSTASNEVMTEETTSNTSSDCDEFLKGYEKFMDKYIGILKKYKQNPSDMSIMSEYTSLASEAQEWATKTADCSSDSEFASKISAIQMKIANAAAGM